MVKYLIKQEMLHYLDKILLSILSFVCFVNVSLAQKISSEDEKKWFIADKAFDYGDYLTAVKTYKILLEVEPANDELNYKTGVCLFSLPDGYKDSALFYLSKVKANKYDELNYYLGRLNHLARLYPKAILNFEAYKKIKPFNRLHSDKEVEDLISRSNVAQLFESRPNKSLQIINLGEQVNSIYADYGPKITAEGNELFFTSKRKNIQWINKDAYGNYFENIYSSIKKEDWQTPSLLSDKINSKYNESCTGVSHDGEKMLIFRTSEDLKRGHIYESYKNNDGWTSPIKLTNNINTEKYTETSACFSPDGNSIYFSSNRPGGFGGKDLYVVKKLPNGSWSEAFNLGGEVNTMYDENTPFVHPSGKILFFSSKGHENMGGYDNFKVNFDETGKYSDLENLGYPINTNDDDLFFVLGTDGSRGYLSSRRKGGEGSYDIYEVLFSENILPLNVYQINVFDEKNKIIKNVDISLVELETKKRFGKYKSNEYNGKMIIISETNKEYEITIKADGYQTFITQSVLNENKQLTFTLSKVSND